MAENEQSEAVRLEALWGGEFGDRYVERNADAYDHRRTFWQDLRRRTETASVLEVGCNVGGNLRWLVDDLPDGATWGVDVNRSAIDRIRAVSPGVNAVLSPGRELPFRDRWFDLVFTMGVLIHQPDSTLPLVMAEMVRCSRRFVLCGEYYAPEATEVPYHGHQGALFKRDYGGLFADLFPGLALVDEGFLSRDEGWDDVTWWLFRRR
jgi:pseudaminic acid biosynthesis-associated methylase